MISTERFAGKAPIELDIDIPTDVRRGVHQLAITLTYFNGAEWRQSQVTQSITVRSLYQQYETAIAGIAIAAAVLTLIQTVYTVLGYYGAR